MEAYKKWVAKSAAVTALWCVLELNVNVPMKVRHVSEHNVWFLRRSLPSHCRSLWPARSAHSVVGKGAEEVDRCSGVKAGSKPAIANHKWKLWLGVRLPQVLYAFDFSFFPPPLTFLLDLCKVCRYSMGPVAHTRLHVWKDEQKNTSDSLMEPAAATRVTALFPKGLKEHSQRVSWGRVHI